MGLRNYLVEGVSTTGKTAVCNELRARGHHAVNGDRELAYQGDPITGAPTAGRSHQHHVWDEGRVREIAADPSKDATFFCGGSRNFRRFLDVFDKVFVLDVDTATLERRLADRPAGEFGSRPEEQELVRRLHQTREDIPQDAVVIDATAPLTAVVDRILSEAGLIPGGPAA